MIRSEPCQRLRLTGKILLVLLLLCYFLPLYGQETGTLRVLVTDTSGAVVPGSEVRAVNVDTNESFNSLTNASGYVVFTPIPHGTYTVTVSNSGFTTVRINSVAIDVAQDRQMPVQLTVAAVSSTVEVSAAAAALQTEEASLGALVTGEHIVALPLAQRRYTDLAFLVPGASESVSFNPLSGTNVLVNGTRSRGNNFLLDGFNNNASGHINNTGTYVISPPPDALTEFKVQTNNFAAEYGMAIGAVINVSIKSGTNQFHGSAWEFNRDTIFAANSWASNSVGAPKQELKWNQPGGTFGGPIIKNKLFFFSDFEAFHQVMESSAIASAVPTAAMHTGDFSSLTTVLTNPSTNVPFPLNKIPGSSIDPLGQKIVNLYPNPNTAGVVGAGGRPANNYAATIPATDTAYRTDLRVDYNLSTKNHFFGRYGYNTDFRNNAQILGAATGNNLFHLRNQQGSVAWTRQVASNTINELRFSYNNQAYDADNTNQGQNVSSSFGFKGVPAHLDGNIPQMAITNYQALGVANWTPQYHNPWSYEGSNTLSIVKGVHVLKMGGSYRIKQDNWVDIKFRTLGYSFQGRFTGDGVADVLLGLPQTVSGENFMVAHERQQIWTGFFQDQWKASPRLTLELGLRYEYYTPYYGVGGNTNIGLDFATGQLLIAPGGQALVYGASAAKNKYGMSVDRNNFAPRMGFAYQVNNRVVLRSGFGVFYDAQDNHGTTPDSILNPPNIYPVTLQRIGNGPSPLPLSEPVPSNLLDLSTIPSSNLSLEIFPQTFVASKIYQWNTTVQYQVTSDSTMEVAYVGNRATALDVAFNADNAAWGLNGTIAANRRYPQWQGIDAISQNGYSNYNALQAKFEKRGKFWSTLTSFTWASSINTTETSTALGGNTSQIIIQTPAGPEPDENGERGFAASLSRLRLTSATTWDIPIGRKQRFVSNIGRALDLFIGGWRTSYILTTRSGLPVNVTLGATGVDPNTGKAYAFLSNEGGGIIRPNRIGSPNTGISPQTNRYNFLNPAAFQLQPIDTPGNAARNSSWGPSSLNLDLGLSKRIVVTERNAVELRFEAFNALNHVNFANPAAVWGVSGFGVITSAAAPRQIQMAVKYAF
jgi:hypothetical protein